MQDICRPNFLQNTYETSDFSGVFFGGHAEKTPRTGSRHFSAPRFPFQSFFPRRGAGKKDFHFNRLSKVLFIANFCQKKLYLYLLLIKNFHERSKQTVHFYHHCLSFRCNHGRCRSSSISRKFRRICQ